MVEITELMINEIQINRYRDYTKPGYRYNAHIYIDGRSLIEMVREVELPYALAEGSTDIAGSYAWLDIDTLNSNILNLPRNYNVEEEKATLLGCPCGEDLCWPFSVRIKNEGDKIVWTDFEQSHRNKESDNYWSYDGLEPFIFDLEQYVGQLPLYYKRYYPFRPF